MSGNDNGYQFGQYGKGRSRVAPFVSVKPQVYDHYIYPSPIYHAPNRPYLDFDALYLAYDCIMGLPFRGSLAYIGVIGGSASNDTFQIRSRSQGPADVRWLMQAGGNQIVLHAISSGFQDGNQTRLVVNGIDYSVNRRGINAILLDPTTLDIRSENFDTHLYSGDGNTDLQSFIAEALRHPGFALAIAVKDDAATNLTLESKLALKSVGVDVGLHDNATALDALLNERGHRLPPKDASILMNIGARLDAPRCIEILSKHGWNINAHAVSGMQNTPLHDAVRRGNLAAMTMLMSLSADHTQFNRERRSPDDIARLVHKRSCVSDLIRKSKSPEADIVESVFRELGL